MVHEEDAGSLDDDHQIYVRNLQIIKWKLYNKCAMQSNEIYSIEKTFANGAYCCNMDTLSALRSVH